MRVWLNLAAAALALVSAFALYLINYDTRRIEAQVQAQERALDTAEADIAVLKAERAHLGRPERIEPLARGLGMRPLAPGQYRALDESAPKSHDPR